MFIKEVTVHTHIPTFTGMVPCMEIADVAVLSVLREEMTVLHFAIQFFNVVRLHYRTVDLRGTLMTPLTTQLIDRVNWTAG